MTCLKIIASIKDEYIPPLVRRDINGHSRFVSPSEEVPFTDDCSSSSNRRLARTL